MSWVGALLAGSAAVVDVGYSLGNMAACFMFLYVFVDRFIRRHGKISARSMVWPMCKTFALGVLAIVLGLSFALTVETMRKTDSILAQGCVVFMLGFSRTCLLMTCAVPFYFLL